MGAQEELDRLASRASAAIGETVSGSFVRHRIGAPVSAEIRGVAHTGAHATEEAAVAELRAILRADSDRAIADVLDTLAAKAERGPITAEMLRAMAQARRGAWSFESITPSDLAPWMERPLPTRPATHPSSVVIPCDSPEHADRLARLLREMADDPGFSLTSSGRVLFSACVRAEVQR